MKTLISSFIIFLLSINYVYAGIVNGEDRTKLVNEYITNGNNESLDDSDKPTVYKINNDLYGIDYRYGDLAPRLEIVDKKGNSYRVIDVTSDDSSLCRIGNSGIVNGIGNVIIINCTVGNIEEWSRILTYSKSSGIKEFVAYANAAQIKNGILEVLMRKDSVGTLSKYKNVKIYKK